MNGLMMPKPAENLYGIYLGSSKSQSTEKQSWGNPGMIRGSGMDCGFLACWINSRKSFLIRPILKQSLPKLQTRAFNILNVSFPIPVPWVALKKKLLKIIQYPLEPTHRGETKIVITLPTTPLLIGLRQPKRATNQINMLSNDSWILVEQTAAKQKIETVQWFPLLDLFKKELKIPIQTVSATLPSVPLNEPESVLLLLSRFLRNCERQTTANLVNSPQQRMCLLNVPESLLYLCWQ